MNILIVDDELNTRNGIRDIVGWERFGVDISDIRLAENGLKALEIIESFVPDILICDIRMPKMDGIELVKKLRDNNKLSQPQVIFLSAFSDKEYLKAAIKYDAIDYVEKPVDITEFERSLRRAVEKNKKEKYVNSSILEMIIKGDTNAVKQLASKWGSSLEYLVFQLGVNWTDSRNDDFMQSVFDKLTIDFTNVMWIETEPNIWTVLIGTAKEAKADLDINGIYNSINKQTREFGCEIAISYCESSCDNKKLPELLKRSMSGTDSFFFCGYGNVYCIARTDSRSTGNGNISGKLVNSLLNLKHKLMFPKESEMMSVVTENKTPKQVRSSSLQLLILISNHLKNRYPKLKYTLNIDRWQEKLDSIMTIDALMDFVINEANKMLKDVSDYLEKENSLEKVKRYIEKHYSEQISLEKLADKFNYSSGYLSHIFKKTYGIGLCSYIISLRLKKAKELMTERNLALNEISYKVGFPDYAHFSRTFKKEEGLAPRQWTKR